MKNNINNYNIYIFAKIIKNQMILNNENSFELLN
jgi:hypothetical protein